MSNASDLVGLPGINASGELSLILNMPEGDPRAIALARVIEAGRVVMVEPFTIKPSGPMTYIEAE